MKTRAGRILVALGLLSTLSPRLSTAFGNPGDLDSTFAGTGKVSIGFGGGPAFGHAAVVQSDGKLLIAGGTDLYGTNNQFAIVRFGTNNLPDPSFGLGGKVLTRVGPMKNAVANALAIQADGKIVAAGYAANGTNNFNNYADFALARYNPDGSLDTSFGNSGKVITTFNFFADEVINAMVIQPDGKILVAGGFNQHFFTPDTGLALARYETNGVLDASFGSGGIVTTDFSGNGGFGYGLLLQPDGKIVAAGTSLASFALARLTTNGVLDTTFNGSGILRTAVGAYGTFFGSAVAYAVGYEAGDNTPQNPDKIIAAGTAAIGFGLSGFAAARYKLDGSLDNSFDGDGTVTNVFDPNGIFIQSYGQALLLQGGAQSHKLMVGGYVSSSGNTSNYFGLARLNDNGSLDTGFGTNGTGRVIFSPVLDSGQAYALAFQGSQIVLAGYAAVTSRQMLAAARFSSNGVPDAAFGQGGLVTADTDLGSRAQGLAAQSDGKLIVVGGADVGLGTNFALARLNANGSLDGAFGTNGGKVTLTGGASNAVAAAVRLQSDGKILAAGCGYNGGTNDFAVARCNPDGSLDLSFGGTGEVTTAVGSSNAAANAMALQTDGKIILAGYGFSGVNQDFAVVRYNTNGTLDTSFGGTGKVITGVGAGGAQASAVQIQTDGKIVTAGRATVGSDVDIALVRYNTNGTLDNAFGTVGRVTTDFGGGTDGHGLAMAIQPDGKILVAGGVVIGGTGYIALLRYNTNGVLDAGFGFSGEVITQIGSLSDYATALALQPDGKIVVAGTSQNGAHNQPFAQRYNPDGTPDSSFGNGGTALWDFGSGADEFGYALVLDPSGRPVIAADAGGLFGVARLLGDALPKVFLSISLTATNSAVVSWLYPSTGWNLQQNTNLPSTNWTTPSEAINNDGTNNFIIVNAPSGKLFFRLQR